MCHIRRGRRRKPSVLWTWFYKRDPRTLSHTLFSLRLLLLTLQVYHVIPIYLSLRKAAYYKMRPLCEYYYYYPAYEGACSPTCTIKYWWWQWYGFKKWQSFRVGAASQCLFVSTCSRTYGWTSPEVMIWIWVKFSLSRCSSTLLINRDWWWQPFIRAHFPGCF